MQKISGIIPSNSRLSSVDLSKATPTRKGHPNVGQPQVETKMRSAEQPKVALRQAGGVYSQVADARVKGREQAIQANDIEDAYFASKVDPEIMEGFEEGREVLILETIPVEVSEEELQESGTNLSVVA